MAEDKPYIWILDSDRKPLAECADTFADWADVLYIGPGQIVPDWDEPPDAVIFSAEIAGGVEGQLFGELIGEAGDIPLLAAAKLRSLSQALGYFRAGAADYLPLPLDPEETRDRLYAALEKAAQRTLRGLAVQLEPADPGIGEISLSLKPAAAPEEEDDILAQLSDDLAEPADSRNDAPETPENSRDATEPEPTEPVAEQPPLPEPESEPVDDGASAPPPQPETADEDEPEAVDGLPIPTLWEELPCGLLVFDSAGNLVFSNSLGLDLFGQASLAELGDALENRLAGFNAHAANHRPLPDNQWPQILARKSRTARSAVVSIEKPDNRRLWLRIDCLPHLAEGKINRLTMTVVNLTGELPPLPPPTTDASAAVGKRPRTKPRGKRRK